MTTTRSLGVGSTVTTCAKRESRSVLRNRARPRSALDGQKERPARAFLACSPSAEKLLTGLALDATTEGSPRRHDSLRCGVYGSARARSSNDYVHRHHWTGIVWRRFAADALGPVPQRVPAYKASARPASPRLQAASLLKQRPGARVLVGRYVVRSAAGRAHPEGAVAGHDFGPARPLRRAVGCRFEFTEGSDAIALGLGEARLIVPAAR